MAMTINWNVKAFKKGLLLAAAAVILTTPQAHAGFEWTPPPQVKATAPVMAAPAPAVEREPLDGVMLPDVDAAASQPPAIEPFPMESSRASAPVTAPPVIYEEPVAPQPAPPPVMPSAAYSSAPFPAIQATPPVVVPPAEKVIYEQAQGFGKDIPLVLAMRQVVPDNYSYSFDQGVNPGQRISWNGGKPWNEVLEDALRPLDMRVMVSGNTVWVRKTWDDMEAPADALAMTPPPANAPSVAMPHVIPSAMMKARAPLEAENPPPAPIPTGLSVFEQQPPMPPQSYPRRQRPDMPGRDIVSPASPSQDFIVDDTPRPVPLMGTSPFAAVPPAPPAPATAPAPVMQKAQNAVVAPATGPGASGGPVMDPLNIGYWTAEPGEGLKDVLERWATAANVTLVWLSPGDYGLPEQMRMHGTFADAVTAILALYTGLDPRPLGRLHPNLPAGPSVLVVENYSSATN